MFEMLNSISDLHDKYILELKLRKKVAVRAGEDSVLD